MLEQNTTKEQPFPQPAPIATRPGWVGSAQRHLPIHWDELKHIRGAGPSPGRPVCAGAKDDKRPSLLAKPWG